MPHRDDTPSGPPIDHHVDLPRVRAALDLLSQVSPDARLLQLRNLCINNGLWAVPEDARDYRPVLFEVQLFGVPALADDPADLPANWMRAARNILDALHPQAA